MAIIGALAIVGVAAALGVHALHPQHPQLPEPLNLLAEALGLAQVSVPADWAIDKQPPPVAENLKITASLGELAEPFAHPDANAAWRQYRAGNAAKALELAEKHWRASAAERPADKDSDKNSDNDRRMFAFLLAQLRWADGKKTDAIAAARYAAGHPAMGIAALRWVVARADEAGLSAVVLGLAANRPEPGLRLAKARALRRNGEYRLALAELDAIAAAKGTTLFRRAQVERIRALQASADDDRAMALAREMLAGGAKSAQAEEIVDLVLGGSDAGWQKRLERRPQDAALVLDALVFTAQRRRYPRAIAGLDALAKAKGIDVAVACHAQSWLAKCYDRKADFDKSLAALGVLAEKCEGKPEIAALIVDEDPLGAGDIAWRKGRALGLQGKLEGAQWLKKALDQGLGGVEAGEAKLLAGALQDAGAREVLEKQGPVAAADYAERDMADVALWRVALQRMIDKDWKGALGLLDGLAENRDSSPAPVGDAPAKDARFDDRDWAMGRADYFAGRALWALNKKDAAVQRWQRTARRHPLSYYAQMALAQLRAAGQGDAAALTQPDAKLLAGPPAGNEWLADQRVQRARLLGQLGWHDEAGEELDAAGLGRDPGGAGKWQAGDPARTWSRAALDDEAGRWTASHAVGRDLLRAYTASWPHDGNRKAWQIAYPRGFQSLMDAAAKEFELHPSVAYAICRSESGFNPRIESSAHAYGLLQLIVPTAKAMAKGLDVDATAETLKTPAVNVRLGAKYLKKLFDRFEREQQMAAGYNAGGGAVGRWRKQRGDWPMDLFVETIPFRETRDYAKRVSSAIAVYRNLYYGDAAFELALTQKPVPSGDEPATEPSGLANPLPAAPARIEAIAAAKPQVDADAVQPAAKPAKMAKPGQLAKPSQPAKPAKKLQIAAAVAGKLAKGRDRMISAHVAIAKHPAARAHPAAKSAAKPASKAAAHSAVREKPGHVGSAGHSKRPVHKAK